MLDTVEVKLGLRFVRRELLSLALVHGSFVNEMPGARAESNERLEFLGDAVINAVVAQEMYLRHPEWPEGLLTSARAAIVRTETLAKIAQSLELGQHLLMGKGEEASGGRGRPTNLAATFEAVTGALFLDQGYEAARAFALRTVGAELEDVVKQRPPRHAKTALQELAQSMGMPPPTYNILEATGPDHAREFTAEVTVGGEVKGKGTGSRKSLAEQRAAEQALEALGHRL